MDSPTLFNIFINYIPKTDNTQLSLYADDTEIFAESSREGSDILESSFRSSTFLLQKMEDTGKCQQKQKYSVHAKT